MLELACNYFGCSPDQELYAAVRDASPATLSDFREAYHDFASRTRLKALALQPGMLRPYLRTEGRAGFQPWLWGGFDLRQILGEPNGVWRAVDQIKHRLLYCHSVAVDDPLDVPLMLAASEGGAPPQRLNLKAAAENAKTPQSRNPVRAAPGSDAGDGEKLVQIAVGCRVRRRRGCGRNNRHCRNPARRREASAAGGRATIPKANDIGVRRIRRNS